MGMIIKDKIRALFAGYPTVSDKYNVSPAVLAGSDAVKFGDLVKFSSTKGYFEAIGAGGVASVADIAGFVLATNVKLAKDDNTTVVTKPGEAFNLAMWDTFMAIELDSEAEASAIAPKGAVKVILATGKCTTAAVASGIVELPGVHFTGFYEEVDGKLLAEIYIH